MAYQWATWLADVLRAAGCPVIEEPGWKTRGRPGGTFQPRGVMLHHDASPPGETSGGAGVIINGRPDVPGPLAQLWLDYDGRWHVCAAGRANHAGSGAWHDIPNDDANSYILGIETDHTTNEQWTDAQFDSGTRGLVALADHLGIRDSAGELKDWMLAHKEWAPGRKVDPDPLDMDDLRALVLAGAATTDEGLFGMTTVDVFGTSARAFFRGGGKWSTVTVDSDGSMALVVGPKDAYVAVAGVTIEGSGEDDSVVTGDVVQLRFQSMLDHDDPDMDTEVDVSYPITEVPITGRFSYGNLTWTSALGEVNDARRLLRLFIMPPDGKSCTVTRVTARALY
jgi:hypothetical protein